MAQQKEKGGRVVFIGNIPYGVSEEQICEIFGRVGQVVHFRLVYDKETGRPKGFGFLEYTDVDAAASAVRNLNGHEIMGRTLKVDYSNDNGGGQRIQNQNQGQDHLQGGNPFGGAIPGGPPNGAAELPPLPPGTDVPEGLTAPDAISQTLARIPPPQLLDFISQMKGLVSTDPNKATALLNTAPQLSYATFQALLLLGLVDTNVIGSLIQTTAPQPPVQQQPPPGMPYAQPPPPTGFQQPPYGQLPPPPNYGAPPPAQFQGYGQAGYNPTPPVPQPAYQPPPPQPQASALPPPPEQAALIQQLMSMTREQIFAQDEGTRNTILQLRAQYGAPVN